jgi:hypothetical protein
VVAATTPKTEVVRVTDLMAILGALAGLVVVSMTVTVLLVTAVYRRIRRSRALNRAALRSRAFFSSGGQRRALRLRIELRDCLESGRAAVDLAARSGSARGELPRLFRRIQAEGIAVDAHLRLLESETDPRVLAEELSTADHRVHVVTGMVRELRSAVASGLGVPTDGALTALRSEVDREVVALHAGDQELYTLNRPDGRSRPQPARIDHPR